MAYLLNCLNCAVFIFKCRKEHGFSKMFNSLKKKIEYIECDQLSICTRKLFS